METYDRVPNVVWQLSYPTDHKPVAFVYIDYNIDTVYVEALTGANRHIWPSIGKVQYLAYELQQPRAFKEWDMLKSDCPMLKDLTFIAPGPNIGLKHDEEGRLVDVTANFGVAMTLPQLTPDGSYHQEQLAKAVDDQGNVALLGAEAKETLGYFEKHVRDQAEWKDVSWKITILTRRKFCSVPWILTYPIYGTFMEEYDHWHEESIILGDGALTSCRPVFHSNHLCGDCGMQRWLNPTMLSGFSRVREKRRTGAEDHMIHLQGQLKM